MRYPIEDSPRDGTAIILEDDASGSYDVAHWSTEAGKWLGENGEPTDGSRRRTGIRYRATSISPERTAGRAPCLGPAAGGDLPRSP